MTVPKFGSLVQSFLEVQHNVNLEQLHRSVEFADPGFLLAVFHISPYRMVFQLSFMSAFGSKSLNSFFFLSFCTLVAPPY